MTRWLEIRNVSGEPWPNSKNNARLLLTISEVTVRKWGAVCISFTTKQKGGGTY